MSCGSCGYRHGLHAGSSQLKKLEHRTGDFAGLPSDNRLRHIHRLKKSELTGCHRPRKARPTICSPVLRSWARLPSCAAMSGEARAFPGLGSNECQGCSVKASGLKCRESLGSSLMHEPSHWQRFRTRLKERLHNVGMPWGALDFTLHRPEWIIKVSNQQNPTCPLLASRTLARLQ